ncbi:MAG TPA: CPBP family intramembrane glutamic endopeptidase [Candidatus Dormibacteraeota bacterium]|nr:CPBP family intramembrane glutamic endopeptidase [Candidatus Dormibacteraeota bacterium]
MTEAIIAMVVTLPVAIWSGWPTMWFLVPFAIITLTRRPYDVYGLIRGDLGSVRFHVITCAVIFGGYALLHYAFARVVLGLHFVPTLAPDFLQAAFFQFVAVGLSEELFFRGYLQTHLNAVYGRPYRFLGTPWGRGLIYASILFGLCHIVTGDISRLRVAFFGLFAGWLRERTGTIAVPAAYHGFANLLYDFMARSMV